MAGVIQFPIAGGIKSIQYGFMNILNAASSGTATVVSVNVARAVLIYLGSSTDNASTDPRNFLPTITLTNATTVTAGRGSTTGNLIIQFVVVEYY